MPIQSIVSPHFFVDYRERVSGIPELLRQKGAEVIITTLPAGDYLINSHVLVERKSSADFVQSIISGRIFHQCSKVRKSNYLPLILLEGNIYNTNYRIDNRAIQGAILSIIFSWGLPVLQTAGPFDTSATLFQLSRQESKTIKPLPTWSRKSKKSSYRQVSFLQGLPGVGPTLAQRLLDQFGCIENVVLANSDMLSNVPGVGIQTAKKIRRFLNSPIPKIPK